MGFHFTSSTPTTVTDNRTIIPGCTQARCHLGAHAILSGDPRPPISGDTPQEGPRSCLLRGLRGRSGPHVGLTGQRAVLDAAWKGAARSRQPGGSDSTAPIAMRCPRARGRRKRI